MTERRLDLYHGDCREVLRELPDASIDAIVTDPPAGIAFMNAHWDRFDRAGFIVFMTSVMSDCLRVLKPGGHALVWALPRTSHWTATTIEDAGFEIRDVVMHLFGTGFPKSHSVSKAIDAHLGAERTVVGYDATRARPNRTYGSATGRLSDRSDNGATITAPASDQAKTWSGWGTALKPAAEHWILARKPLDGTVAANVIKHGVGGLNVDGCRIARPVGDRTDYGVDGDEGPPSREVYSDRDRVAYAVHAEGRFPANVTLDTEAAALLDEQSVGGASRFFYVAKASRADKTADGQVENKHPTVKNNSLMRWLCRLITPPGGVVLDPFMGSGSTGIAAWQEGFGFVGIEAEQTYYDTAFRRFELLLWEGEDVDP